MTKIGVLVSVVPEHVQHPRDALLVVQTRQPLRGKEAYTRLKGLSTCCHVEGITGRDDLALAQCLDRLRLHFGIGVFQERQ